MACTYNGKEYSEGASICVGGEEQVCTSEGTWEFTGNACDESENNVSEEEIDLVGSSEENVK